MTKLSKILILSLISILIFGCQKQGPVELIDDIDDTKLMEVAAISPSFNEAFEPTTIDTTGLIKPHQYYAKMFFTAIRYERPLKTDSVIQAEAIFYKKSEPIIQQGRIIAYPSYDVGNLSVNSDMLKKILRKLGPFLRDTLGFRYHLIKPYQLSSNYEWIGTGKSPIDSFRIPFTFPSEIRVLNLRPSFISVSEPLNIKWKCQNPVINLMISAEDDIPPDRTLKPLLHLKIRNTKGGITIPQKILKALPWNKHQKFIFTFSSENRFVTNISGYPDSVLVHSASIHNIVVSLRP